MLSRRDYLAASALVATGLLSELAGCGARAAGPTSTDARSRVDGGLVAVEPDYEGWFKNVSNYEGTVDLRGRERVTVQVGAKGNMGSFAFAPAAIAVSPGTTVVWEWTGKGGVHNVVAESGAFDSGQLVNEKGFTFEQTFDDAGVFTYFCEPHRTMGMRGAVFVTLGAPQS